MTTATLERDLVIITCAISAGVHAGLAPAHLREGLASGVAFAAAALLLGMLAVALTRVTAGAGWLVAAALVLGGLIVGYGLSITVGLPPLHPETEQVDGLALVTKAVEATGLLAALLLLGRAHLTIATREKGLQT